jgi:hypothetical protein
LLSDYEVIVLGDREFGSVKLASWLSSMDVKFIIRVKQGRYILGENSDYIRLSDLGLLPGTSFYLSDVKITKQKGFELLILLVIGGVNIEVKRRRKVGIF